MEQDDDGPPQPASGGRPVHSVANCATLALSVWMVHSTTIRRIIMASRRQPFALVLVTSRLIIRLTLIGMSYRVHKIEVE